MSKIYETAVKIHASISKAFKGDAEKAAGALTKLSGAAKQLQSAEKAAGSVKKLTAAVAASKAKYNAASEALQKLKAAETEAGKATKESTKERKLAEKELKKYAKEMDRATKAAEKNAAASKSLPQARYEAARAKLFGERKQGGPLAEKAGAQFGGITRDIAAVATVATAAGAAMVGLMMKSLKAGDEIGDTAEKLGIGAQALQELRYGAAQSGAEAGALDKALVKLAVNIGKVNSAKKKGGGGLTGEAGGLQFLGGLTDPKAAPVDPFKTIHLSAKKLAGLKPDQQLRLIADGIKKLKTHSEQAAAAQAILGKTGSAQLLPFLKEGSAGIDKLSAAAHKYGGIMTKEQVDAADAADKAMRDAEMAFNGVANTLGSALLPTAVKVFGEFSTWVAENKGAIKEWAATTATWIETKAIPAIVKIAGEVKWCAEKAFALADGVASLVGGFGNLAIVVAAMRLAPLVVTIIQMGVAAAASGVSLSAFVAPLLVAAAPIVATAAALAAVGIAINEIVGAVRELGGLGRVWDDFKEWSTNDKGPATSHGNKKFAEMQAENSRRLSAGQNESVGAFSFSPTINVGGASKEELSSNIDKANAKTKQAALDAYDNRNASRLAFSE